jgi:integrase/recombinase XerD
VLRESGDAVKHSTRRKVEDFLGGLKPYKVQSVAVPEEDILTPHEIDRLKENASPRLRLIVRFLYHTGARVSEMTAIKQTDIEEKPDHYRVHIVGKGKKARTLKVNKQLMADVQERFQGGTYLFETRPYRNGRAGGRPLDRHNLAGEIRRLGRRFLGKRVTPHSFRHAFATHLIAQGKGIKAVSNYVGHSSVSTTLDLYVHETLKPEDLPG